MSTPLERLRELENQVRNPVQKNNVIPNNIILPKKTIISNNPVDYFKKKTVPIKKSGGDNLLENASKGAYTVGKYGVGFLTGLPEGIASLASTGIGALTSGIQGIFDKEGAKKTSEFWENVTKNTNFISDYLNNAVDNTYGKYGKIDNPETNIVGQVADTIGNLTSPYGAISMGNKAVKAVDPILKAIGAGAKTTKVVSKAASVIPFALQTAGSSSKQAIEEGADINQALDYGIKSAASESLIELISGGIGGTASNKILSKAGKNVIGKTVAKVGDTLIDITGEGLEEAISTYVDPLLKRMTYNEKAELASNKQALDNFVISAITSSILKGGQKTLDFKMPVLNKNTTENISKNGTIDSNQIKNINTQNRTSKINDLVYHGSPISNLTMLDIAKSGSNTQSEKGVVYFTNDKNFAEDFSYERIPTESSLVDKKGKKGKVYEANINLNNPLDLTNLTDKMIDDLVKMDLNKIYTRDRVVEYSKAMNGQLLKTAINYDRQDLKKYGYDGIIAWADKKKGVKEYGVLDNNQIKLQNATSQNNVKIPSGMSQNQNIELINKNMINTIPQNIETANIDYNEILNQYQKVYHGSKENISDNQLKPGVKGSRGAAVYTTTDIEQAKKYGDINERYIDKSANLFNYDKLNNMQLSEVVQNIFDKNNIKYTRDGNSFKTDKYGFIDFEYSKNKNTFNRLLKDLNKDGITEDKIFRSIGYD